MRFHAMWVVIALLSSAFPARVAGQDPPPKHLVGTWKLVSAKYGGQESQLSTGFTTLKHFTPTHFMWVSFDKTRKVTRTGGGPYSFDGKTLEDTPEYGLGSTSMSYTPNARPSSASSKAKGCIRRGRYRTAGRSKRSGK
jgi:hypothetical protein